MALDVKGELMKKLSRASGKNSFVAALGKVEEITYCPSGENFCFLCDLALHTLNFVQEAESFNFKILNTVLISGKNIYTKVPAPSHTRRSSTSPPRSTCIRLSRYTRYGRRPRSGKASSTPQSRSGSKRSRSWRSGNGSGCGNSTPGTC